MSRPATTVGTIVRGRQDHLANLLEGLHRQTCLPTQVVVGWMGGPDPTAVCRDSGLPVTVVDASSGVSDLPLAHARNTVRRWATGNLLVFLDVDVIPSSRCVEDYVVRVDECGGVWSGHVGYLPAGVPGHRWSEEDLEALARPNPVRPPPDRDGPLPRPELFWSLSFACATATFDRVGGFDEDFVGYGAEDTDIALRWDATGVRLWQTPRAVGYHQHHDTTVPPVQHLNDIVRNAQVFRSRWGRWPMEGWLSDFRDDGLIDWDPEGDLLQQRTGVPT